MDEKTAEAFVGWIEGMTDTTRVRARPRQLERFSQERYGVEIYVDGRRVWTVTELTRKQLRG